RGNMWKFNLNNASTAAWGVDLGGQPLFKAGAARPITAPPAAVPMPIVGTTKPDKGYMVLFGTGKFYEITDITNTDPQHLYGVWDPLPFGATVIPPGTALTDTSSLVEQVIGAAQTGENGNNYFAITNNAVDYTSATPKRGWHMSLPVTGQR